MQLESKSIDELLPYLHDREWLEAQLLKSLAEVSSEFHNLKQREAAFLKAQKLLDDLDYEFDKTRLDNLLWVANTEAAFGYRSKAVHYYQEILAYDWSIVDDPTYLAEFKDLYVNSARGLIDEDKGFSHDLDDLRFWPAVLDKLAPVLAEAKRETVSMDKGAGAHVDVGQAGPVVPK